MAGWPIPFRNIDLGLRPSPRKLKLLFAALVLACIAAVGALGWAYHSIRQQTQDTLSQAAALERENEALSETKEHMDSEAVKKAAREELGLVDPDTILFDPN